MSAETSFAALTFPSLRSGRQDTLDLHARASGHAAGYAAGLRAAHDEFVARVESLDAEHAASIAHGTARIDRAVELLAAATRAISDTAIPVLAEAQDVVLSTAMDLAETIIGVELSDEKSAAKAAITRALAAVDASLVREVRLNPVDLALLGDALRESTCRGVTFVADPNLQRGDAVTKLPDGFLDARISTAVARAKAAILGPQS